MSSDLDPIWQRVDQNPPTLLDEEVNTLHDATRQWLQEQKLLRPGEAWRFATCTGCGQGTTGPVQWLPKKRTGGATPYLACPECGPVVLDADSLRNWVIDIPGLLSAVMQAADGRGTPIEVVPDHGWFLGTAVWSGRRRQVCFVRCVHEGSRARIVEFLGSRPKSVLLFSNEATRLSWRGSSPNPTVALESIVMLRDRSMVLDLEPIDTELENRGLVRSAGPKSKTTLKRSSRAAKIELLKLAVIQHIMAASESAKCQISLNRPPALLPRPTQKDLAALCGLEEYDVSRCFGDEAGRELNFYWNLALDLERVIQFRGPISGGRKT